MSSVHTPDEMRNIETGRLKTRTNSCVGLMRTQAGIFATMHPHRRSGYKEANSESNLRELGAMTTYKQFYEKGVEIPYMQKSNISVNYKQKLHKYDPNALCNRLPVKFDNEPVPFVRFCAPRNISQYELGPKLYEVQLLQRRGTKCRPKPGSRIVWGQRELRYEGPEP
eukprot:755167-Hanusia_phi.AAC.7